MSNQQTSVADANVGIEDEVHGRIRTEHETKPINRDCGVADGIERM
jgi:hypothetical protein